MRAKIIVLAALILITGAYGKVVTQEERFVIKSDKLSIDLALDGGKVQVLPSRDDRECRIAMHYPREKCAVDVRYNEKRGQIDISIKFKKWNMQGDDVPNLILEIPYGPETSLAAHIKAGETEFDLGDLSLADFRLRHWAGETKVSFNEPNRILMKTFDVNVKIGELTMSKLGNARYQEGEINGGIGEMRIDFTGLQVENCVTHVDLNLGETTLILPEDVGLKLRISKLLSEISHPQIFSRRGNFYYSDNYDDSDKQQYYIVSTGIGELKIKVE